MSRLPAAVALLALTAACGGASAPAAKSDVAITALETKAAMTGCTSSPQPLTLAVASCSYGANSVTVATFDTNDHRDLWVLASKTAEGGVVVKGDDWAVSTFDQDDATSLAAALGGTVG